MKLTVIPAQVTTVEDRIAGNLSMTQLLLLSGPLLLSAVIYFLVPPFGKYVLYKLLIACLIGSLSSIASIRLGEKLIINLIVLHIKYQLRPHIYVFRSSPVVPYQLNDVKPQQEDESNVVLVPPSIQVDSTSRINAERLLTADSYRVMFKQQKSGGLIVKVSNI